MLPSPFPMHPPPSRRRFLQSLLAAAGGILAVGQRLRAATEPPRAAGAKAVTRLAAPRMERIRWGLIGLGDRGTSQLEELIELEHCEVTALCDTDPIVLKRAADMLEKAKHRPAAMSGASAEAYRKLVERDDVDAVMICTPWRAHVPQAVAAMRAGKHAFIEVPAAVSLEECWQLVDAAESTQRHCMMMENCCYGQEELMVLRLCREGIFGELLHAEAAYIHDLRFQMKQVERGTGSWRTREHELRDANIYPTHGLGPVAQCLGVNRGDRFTRLTSMSSPSLGMPDFAAREFPPNHPRRTAKYICGDLNTSLIQTALGRTIMVQHNTMSPRPYSRINLVQGTRGVFAGFPNRIHVEGRSPEHKWETDLTKWFAEFDHPLWRKVGEVAAKKGGGMGHGGMDYVMKWRIVECLRAGLPLDHDVYDAAAWSAVTPLSESSVARRGDAIDFPDFTRGAWKERPPLEINL